MIEQAYLVHYGNTLATLCRDLGQAEKTLRTLHGTKLTALYELTEDEIRLLRLAESEKPREP
jgi:hypothetical protein